MLETKPANIKFLLKFAYKKDHLDSKRGPKSAGPYNSKEVKTIKQKHKKNDAPKLTDFFITHLNHSTK